MNIGASTQRIFKNVSFPELKPLVSGRLNKAIQKVKNMATEFKRYPLFNTISPLIIAAAGSALILPIVVHKGLKSLTPDQQEEIKKLVKPGDILLHLEHIDLPPYIPQKLFANSKYSHAAMVVDEENIIEANMAEDYSLAVIESPIEHSVSDCTMQLAILRPKYHSDEERERTIQYLREQWGKPFDLGFNLADNGKFYCSKLAANALQKTGVIKDFNITNFLGKPMVLPDDLMRTPGIEIVKEFEGKR